MRPVRRRMRSVFSACLDRVADDAAMELTSQEMPLPTVCVMMSVYNGAAYLREQIDSILLQEGVDVRLIIRDDGSTDEAPRILASYDDHRVRFFSGPNLGIAESFMEVAFAATTDCDYYAFSDADDVWEPRKLIAGVEALRPLGAEPALFGTRVKFVDEKLRFLGMGDSLSRWHGFGHSLVHTGIGGATSVLNREMFALLRSARPKMFIMHDAWLYMLATGLARIVFSEESAILYRQHGRNASGASRHFRKRWRARWSALRARSDPRRLQALEMERTFGDRMDADKRADLARFAHHDDSVAARIAFLFRNPLVFHTTRARLFYLLRVALFRT